MALPRAYQSAFTPSEIEFIANEQKIKIIPNVRLPAIHLIQVHCYIQSKQTVNNSFFFFFRKTYSHFDHH